MSLIRLDNVHLKFQHRGETVSAVDGVSFSVKEKETLGLIGESGSGKSTIGRLAARLLRPDSGSVVFNGRDLGACSSREMRDLRSQIQVVFQEPYEQLDPRMKVGRIVTEPLRIHESSMSSVERRRRLLETMEMVGLGARYIQRYPGELSGGQQQRVGIARAIISRPSFIILDEPISSLDLSVRAQILDLLSQLQARLGLTYLFISHDINTVEYFCDEVVVLYAGRVMEAGPTKNVLASPSHPYTKALMGARLSPDPDTPMEPLPLRDGLGDSSVPTSGCVFAPRCPIVSLKCREVPIPLITVSFPPQVRCACIKVEEAVDER